MLIIIYGLNWMNLVEEGMNRNCSRDDLDWTAENMR